MMVEIKRSSRKTQETAFVKHRLQKSNRTRLRFGVWGCETCPAVMPSLDAVGSVQLERITRSPRTGTLHGRSPGPPASLQPQPGLLLHNSSHGATHTQGAGPTGPSTALPCGNPHPVPKNLGLTCRLSCHGHGGPKPSQELAEHGSLLPAGRLLQGTGQERTINREEQGDSGRWLPLPRSQRGLFPPPASSRPSKTE